MVRAYPRRASDGSVRLWGGLASSMMSEGPAKMSLLAEVAKADGQAPTCMDVALGVPDSGAVRCLYALGVVGQDADTTFAMHWQVAKKMVAVRGALSISVIWWSREVKEKWNALGMFRANV
eukprot:663547-Pelagomonas_calceolata.AAC.4